MRAEIKWVRGSGPCPALGDAISYFSMNIAQRSVYQNIAKVAALRPEDELLDIACGNGHFVKKYAAHVGTVAGLDISETAIRLATYKNRERVAAGTAQFVCGDASQLPWDDERFSVVTQTGGFFFIFREPFEIPMEVCRVLRPSGRGVFSIEWNAEDGRDRSRKAAKHGIKLLREVDVRAMLREAGFAEISVAYGKGPTMPRIMLVTAVK